MAFVIRLVGFGIVPLALLALWLYCIFDVIVADEIVVRNLPKLLWLLIVIFLPTVGSVAWLTLGRPLYASWRPGDARPRRPPAPRVIGPEDRPDFPARALPPDDREARLAEWEARLRRQEDEMRRKQEGEG